MTALTLRGRDLPVRLVELLQVTDLEPYLEGQRRLQDCPLRGHLKTYKVLIG